MSTTTLASCMRKAAKALPPINGTAFAASFDWLGQYNVVSLGDGSHGTSEFYAARAEISKRLIKEHGFKIVALEVDWPDAEAIDHYVRRWPQHPGRMEARQAMFKRFPTWMWSNREFQGFVRWLRDYNDGLVPPSERAGTVDPGMADEARRRYSKLSRWAGQEQEYGLRMRSRFKSCEADVINMLLELLRKRLEYSAKIHDGE
ncbi:hypothetical protein A1O1_04922 [Capronia coronata CBS 617.96]|uniref:Erythromycin esterase n=1 Tax=Capronia coronata CBS 617.96 TaxID=1182541 RepID=W9YEA7_9EURO|nr:uncharacterized protein A1O1_04922 [Capronia coronata CBS 617.96]EXJ87995.1 hypothetical protein A1O1_04922 [Capronia coronata CBS 617.96]